MPLFKGKEQYLPAVTKAVMGLSDFLVHYWWALLLGVGAVVTALTMAVRTPSGRRTWDIIKLRIPLMGKMFRSLYISRGLSTMGELIRAGVPMLETLDITGQVAGNTCTRSCGRPCMTWCSRAARSSSPSATGGRSCCRPTSCRWSPPGRSPATLGTCWRRVGILRARTAGHHQIRHQYD